MPPAHPVRPVKLLLFWTPSGNCVSDKFRMLSLIVIVPADDAEPNGPCQCSIKIRRLPLAERQL